MPIVTRIGGGGGALPDVESFVAGETLLSGTLVRKEGDAVVKAEPIVLPNNTYVALTTVLSPLADVLPERMLEFKTKNNTSLLIHWDYYYNSTVANRRDRINMFELDWNTNSISLVDSFNAPFGANTNTGVGRRPICRIDDTHFIIAAETNACVVTVDVENKTVSFGTLTALGFTAVAFARLKNNMLMTTSSPSYIITFDDNWDIVIGRSQTFTPAFYVSGAYGMIFNGVTNCHWVREESGADLYVLEGAQSISSTVIQYFTLDSDLLLTTKAGKSNSNVYSYYMPWVNGKYEEFLICRGTNKIALASYDWVSNELSFIDFTAPTGFTFNYGNWVIYPDNYFDLRVVVTVPGTSYNGYLRIRLKWDEPNRTLKFYDSPRAFGTSSIFTTGTSNVANTNTSGLNTNMAQFILTCTGQKGDMTAWIASEGIYFLQIAGFIKPIGITIQDRNAGQPVQVLTTGDR